MKKNAKYAKPEVQDLVESIIKEKESKLEPPPSRYDHSLISSVTVAFTTETHSIIGIPRKVGQLLIFRSILTTQKKYKQT